MVFYNSLLFYLQMRAAERRLFIYMRIYLQGVGKAWKWLIMRDGGC